MKYIICLLTFMIQLESAAQELPLREIPPAPEAYTPGTVIARFTEGLGFRYYWATESLRPEDLAYRPTQEARSAFETIVHIYGLTRFIHDTVMGDTLRVSSDYSTWDLETLRKETLTMLQKISRTLRETTFTPHTIKFPADDDGNVAEVPYWNLLNGPISDALYHTGQVVTMRRTSGNPINPGISVFSGTVQE